MDFLIINATVNHYFFSLTPGYYGCMMNKIKADPEVVVHRRSQVGEGAIWDFEKQLLLTSMPVS